MASLGSKADLGSSQAFTEAMEAIMLMQQCLQKIDARLLKVEEATKFVVDTHAEINAKLDDLYKLLQQRNSPNEFSSQKKPQHPFPNPPSPTQLNTHTLLTADELPYLKKQEAADKISLHQDPSNSTHTLLHDSTVSSPLTFNIPSHSSTRHSGFDTFPTQTLPHNPRTYQHHTTQNTIPQQHLHIPEHHTNQSNTFSLSIARHKLDFPTFLTDEPMNWLRLCEKYFTLARVPTETWVPLATLHCHGVAHTWWRSLRTPATFIHWAQFCNMVFCRFSSHSSHSSLEHFHHLRQTTSIAEYIQKFEELMSLMQMEHPGLTE
jgi:hypothetical protein